MKCSKKKSCPNDAEPGRLWCTFHLRQHRAYTKRNRMKQHVAGLCGYGGCKVKPAKPFRYCFHHREYFRKLKARKAFERKREKERAFKATVAAYKSAKNSVHVNKG